MGASKTSAFSESHNQLAKMAKALAHPARIAIIEHLIEKGSCVCGDLVDVVPLSQATVSQHLKALKEAGILRGETDGVFRCYCIDTNQCKSLLANVAQLFRKVTNCC